MNRRLVTVLALCAATACGLTAIGSPLLPAAVAQEAPRAVFDFEEDTQGFAPIVMQAGQFGVDTAGAAEITRNREHIRLGGGALHYSYPLERQAVRALVTETRLPADTRSVSFWIKANTPSVFLLSLREEDGSDYAFSFYVPAAEWVRVAANLNEFELGQDSRDENNQLDVDQVSSLTLLDMATVLINADVQLAGALPHAEGSRSLWLDAVRFSPVPVAQTSGLVEVAGRRHFLVDNFLTGVVRWTPVHVAISDMPTFHLFPRSIGLAVLPEAAGPGMAKTPIEPGERGLHFSYERKAGELYAIVRSLEQYDLSKADRLRFALNISRPSLLIIQLKEKDGAEYTQIILPEQREGWRTVEFPFSSFGLSENSSDTNDRLDPDQIKDLTILDASATFPGVATGRTTLELDAIAFRMSE
jgi:hypothetical protein